MTLKLLIILTILSPLCLFLHFTQLGMNMTPSLPHKLFLTFKGSRVKKGDLVTIAGHPTRYYPKAHFTKYVQGVSGDRVTTRNRKIYINDAEIGPIHSTTFDGHPLTPLHAQIIPEGRVFIAGDHDRSFDSRYQEFGLVPIHKVVGRAVVLW